MFHLIDDKISSLFMDTLPKKINLVLVIIPLGLLQCKCGIDKLLNALIFPKELKRTLIFE